MSKGAVQPVHAMNAEQRQTTADPCTKLRDLRQHCLSHNL